jgi:phage shock protein PspC (stress-responsive transcriptional regulator)
MKRLYRSRNFALIGGVCSGIALSRGWSISLCRLFALALIGTGLALLLYVVLWILMPSGAKNPDGEPLAPPHDPFARSRDNRMLAGVCGGLAETLNTDPVVVRATFLLLLLVCGVGLVPYVYAWIVVPSKA